MDSIKNTLTVINKNRPLPPQGHQPACLIFVLEDYGMLEHCKREKIIISSQHHTYFINISGG